MSGIQRVVLCGTGPASIQLAITFKNDLDCRVGLAGRESVRSAAFYAALEQSGQQVQVTIQNEKHRALAGKCIVDQIFRGYNTLAGEWQTLVLAVTTDAYIDVLQQIDDAFIKQLKCVILVSPTFGSSLLVNQYLQQRGAEAEIISFSTYLGDTRWLHEHPSNQVITTGVKRKVYIGSTVPSSAYVQQLRELFERLHIALGVMPSPLEAETRNISLYVHPPLFMNAFSLEAIFGEQGVQKYVYKLYPEGPITPALIRSMREQWQEITQITDRLHIQGINLLQFMTDDNYPVRLESLSRHDIEEFDQLQAIHQEFLLYIRYASLLIDPFSEPDAAGAYFDFSGVPFRRIFTNREGELDVPRMPKEDYYRIKIIQGIARHVQVSCPAIDHFIAIYEAKLQETARAHPDQRLSTAFVIQSFQQDIRMICSALNGSKG
ncbi:opine metallophore biosynthesis dehydrogenase [Paenibacillus barcinonensis]|uniref:opine metallophore biosynthesis dehydrogenase n=1 Tax=Paenibacillus barcinonensis TaxID=198119 RepID=UPI001C0F7271|nr:opine metallophore biosynthesis dehydrogenase [Paenibacillus barcinonensis]MBU5354782.1 opine metallophore biosynthesis dehydrogenase [Paenibacillus barcinonensis]